MKCEAPKTRRETALWSGAYLDRLFGIEAKARAVIAAGRPHYGGDPKRIPESCPCPQCTAWDELKTLLEKGEA